MKRLLVVANTPSPNTWRLRQVAVDGARTTTAGSIETIALGPLDAGPADLLRASAVLLGTTENLGTMSGALKDFFERTYYPCLDRTQGLPWALYIRAGHDGTGTRRGVEIIVAGLRWRAVQEPLMLRGPWQDRFADEVRELGAAMAAGLDAGIF